MENKKLELFYCSSENMWADIFTKALPKPKRDICCDAIELRNSIE